MNIVGDAFTVGVVLLLVIAAVAFYLYTRLAQVEKHMNLLESILLDLKVATENSFMGFPGFAMPPSPGGGSGGGHKHVGDEEDDDMGMGMEINEEELEGVLADNFIPTIRENAGGEDDGEEASSGAESPVGTEDITDTDDLEKMLEEVDNAPANNLRVVELSGDAQAVLADKGVHVHKIEPQYETMSVKELKQLAHNRAIKGSSKMSRTEIIDALRKKDSGVEEGVAATAAPSSFNSTAFFGDAAAVVDA
jgi:hypothetical protein